MNLFGRPKPAAGQAAPSQRRAPPDTATAIQDLGKAIETLEKRQTHLEKQQDNLVTEAKQKMLKKDKKGAMYALKKKKMLQSQIDTIMGTMITMEQQKMALENAATNRLAVDAISGAQTAINSAMGGYDVEKVEQIMDDVQDGMQDAEEIGNVLARGLGGDDIMEDDELLAELNEMEQDELTSTLLDVPKVPQGVPSAGFDLPEAPTNMPAVAAAAEEEDEDARVLRELEASMAM